MDLENMAGYGGLLLQNAVKIVETWMLIIECDFICQNSPNKLSARKQLKEIFVTIWGFPKVGVSS